MGLGPPPWVGAGPGRPVRAGRSVACRSNDAGGRRQLQRARRRGRLGSALRRRGGVSSGRRRHLDVAGVMVSRLRSVDGTGRGTPAGVRRGGAGLCPGPDRGPSRHRHGSVGTPPMGQKRPWNAARPARRIARASRSRPVRAPACPARIVGHRGVVAAAGQGLPYHRSGQAAHRSVAPGCNRHGRRAPRNRSPLSCGRHPSRSSQPGITAPYPRLAPGPARSEPGTRRAGGGHESVGTTPDPVVSGLVARGERSNVARLVVATLGAERSHPRERVCHGRKR